MTWTTTDAPREEGDDGGLGGPTWEPLAPGALGADPPPPGTGELTGDLCGDLFGDLPALPLTGPLADALTAARTALDQVVAATTHLTTLGPTQRLDALRHLAATRHTTDAALARLATSFTPEEVRALGATDPVDLLTTHTGADPKNAAATLKLAAALTAPPVQPLTTDPDDPDGAATTSGADPGPGAGSSRVALGLLGAAHATGTVSTDIAALALRTLADLPARIRRACMPTADAYLAAALPGLSHTQAQLVCTTLAHTLDPDRADRGFDPDDLERRYTHLTLHTDGWVDMRARLDPVTGAWVKAALDAAAKPAPTVTAPLADTPHDTTDDSRDDDQGELGGLSSAQDDADAIVPHDAGAAAGAPGGVRVRDERTAPQRRADALAALLKSGAAGNDPSTAGIAAPGGLGARVIVTTTSDALSGGTGTGTGGAPAHCETTNRSLSTAALRTIACSAWLQAVRLSCEGADASVLSLGRTVRLFTATQRRAMLARDGGCVIPGCTSPPGWWEAHHVHEWAVGGPTDVASGVLVCTRHHILVTLGVWQVRMVAGVPQVRPPRTVDPLRRWVLNPRRGLQAHAARAARQMRLDLDLDLGRSPGGPADEPPGKPPEAPDIPSPRGTCAC